MGQVAVEYWAVIQNNLTAMPSTQCYVIVSAGVAGFILGKIYRSLKKSQRRKQWTFVENVVILHQPRRETQSIKDISPFSLKLETYLRMADIRYQIDHQEPTSPQGKTPWITLNGTEISDSELCLQILADHFSKDCSCHLSPEKRAVARALGIMAEKYLYRIALSWKWFYSKETFYSRIRVKLFKVSSFLFSSLSWILNSFVDVPTVDRPSENQLVEMGMKNLRITSRYLGAKPFFMGDQPTEIDCTMFGILSQMVWNLPGSPFQWPLESEFLNLKCFCDRMKDRFWKDVNHQ